VVAGSPNDAAVRVTFDPPTVQGGAAPVAMSCTPASGGEFPIGTSSVTCTATDARSQAASCSFTVTVTPAPRLTVTRILAFGDSLTAGTTSPAPAAFRGPSHSYPFKLGDLINRRYTQQSIEVENGGFGGETASRIDDSRSWGIARLPGYLATFRPQVVLLMEGSNDLFYSHEVGISRGIAALDEMVRDARARGAIVVLATIPPQRAGGLRNRDRVAALIPRFNEQVRAVAARQGAVLVDVYAAIAPDLQRLLGIDDLHLTEAGYQVVAQLFFDAIRSALESQPTASAAHAR
jgi:lysophospholipase L1-like esterase